MNKYLNDRIARWLSRISEQWEVSIEQAAVDLRADEIHNRLQYYPILRDALSRFPLDFNQFSKTAKRCWALGQQNDAIRLNAFINSDKAASDLLIELVQDFPEEKSKAAKRIDSFVSEAVAISYQTPKGTRDWAGAALLASVVLTSSYPKRFVDFRQTRWNHFAEEFDYHHPPFGEKKYGERLIWAGEFASSMAITTTFRHYWPEGEPLWILSGICWKSTFPEKPQPDPLDIEEKESFPEGTRKRRLHLIRERNQTVVKKAKQLAMERDPMLRCAVCKFSFVEQYGALGEGFIEAHHTQPVASLKQGSQTKVEDIALVCANCHRMIHRGEQTLTIEQLRNRLKNRA